MKGAIIRVIRYTMEKRDCKTLETLLLTLRRSESGEGERERRGEESRRGRRGVREKGAIGSLSYTCTCRWYALLLLSHMNLLLCSHDLLL